MGDGYHHGDLKRALLDAARKLITERGGPDRFTMSDAAREAGVSSGAPYRHFKDREGLLQALADEGRARLEAQMREATAGIENPLEQYKTFGMVYVGFAADHPADFQVMSAPEFRPEEPHPDELAFWNPLVEFLSGFAPTDTLPAHPLLSLLAGRALMHGLAHLLAVDALGPVGVGRDRAVQLADAIARAAPLALAPEDIPDSLG
jgi:AcrR family transcriptional regulator